MPMTQPLTFLSKEDLIQEEQNEFLPAPLEHFRLEIHLGDRSITWEKIQMYLPSHDDLKSDTQRYTEKHFKNASARPVFRLHRVL